MPDSKYGRLFTEADVVELLVHVSAVERVFPEERPRGYKEAHESLQRALAWLTERAVRIPSTEHRMTFPADEPLFLLRGQDRAAAPAIRAYANEVARLVAIGGRDADLSATKAVALAASDIGREMAQWQRDHPARTKLPD